MAFLLGFVTSGNHSAIRFPKISRKLLYCQGSEQGRRQVKRLFFLSLLTFFASIEAHAQCDQADWVCIGNPYQPSVPNGTSPTCMGAANPADVQKIQTAYSLILNTPSLANVAGKLCQVKHILLYTPPRHSWGRYNDPSLHPIDAGSTYIGLSTSDLNQSFRSKQDDHLSVAPDVPPGLIHHNSVGPNADDPKYGLVYALAHELGHITWHQQYPLTGPQPGIPCFDAYFGNPSWGGNTNEAKHNRWTDFGADGSLGTPSGIPVPPQTATTPHDIYLIYTNGFATALGAANPEEDFVEAYSFGVLFGVITPLCPACVFTIQFPPPDGTVPRTDFASRSTSPDCLSGD
jgi:hypothetical protein